jgi:phenylacetic acid degradation operon negative regulatory protein
VRPVLDDLESSPGSTTSLLRTVIGTSLRRIGGWIAVADLIGLARAVGLPEPRTRTALSRIKARGLLRPASRGRVPGYALAAEAVPMLARGDRRIYHPRTMALDERWCLLSYSVPEAHRDLRHQLRRRLSWIGCGSVSPALWICPEHLAGEVEEILGELGLTGNATVFLADEVRGVTDLRDAVARWWDLDALRALHENFLAAHAAEIRALGPTPAPERAFTTWVRGLDTWRVIPYRDPGLPGRLLPGDWPGEHSVPLFLELRDRVLPHAHRYVEQATSATREAGGAPP